MNALSTLVTKAKREKRKAKTARLSSVAAACDDGNVGKPIRVNGPYRDRDRWRIYLIDDSGRKSMLFDSREEAESTKSKLVERATALVERTIGESLDDYRDYRIKVRGVLPKTAEDHCRHLRGLLPIDLPIAALTAEKAHRLYLAYAERPNCYTGKPISVATHQWVLLIGKCWGRWLVKSGVSTVNPFAAVEPIGKPNAGKTQLTRDEAQRLSLVAVEKARSGDDAAIGVLLMLHLGLRQGEVGARVARDVDTDGKVLIIPFGKTLTSRRRLKVPDWLRPYVLSLTLGKEPTELLFSADGRAPRRRQYWWNKVRELCRSAGVPAVCPHSLRGLHATLAIEEGASGDAVAQALGHTSFEMTAKHYASGDSVANARLAKAAETLAPPELPISRDRVGSLLSQLSEEERADLRRRLMN
jgi:integrase